MNIQEIIIQISEFLGACIAISIAVKKWMDKLICPITKKLDIIDKNQCRNFLVDFLSDIENGIVKDDIQIKRAYEVYDHYVDDLHGNSYVHDKFERLKKEGKI